MSAAAAEQEHAGIYVHIPFCRTKCRYCDFSSLPGRQDLYEPYVAALLQSIGQAQASWPGPAFDTLYIGGGTPTALAPDHLTAIVEACRTHLALPAEAEITCEANPGTVSQKTLQALRDGGVNRLSLGAQSFDDDELALLGRIHDRQAIIEAFQGARLAGFGNISLDLIYGVPHQSLKSWESTLQQALPLEPEHLSLYALTLEPGTPMASDVQCGALPTPDDALAADMYLMAQEMLSSRGYAQYEISNWARSHAEDTPEREPGLASRHNLHYWRNERYLGLGSAAYSFDGRSRFGRCPDSAEFIRRIEAGEDTTDTVELACPDTQMDETMMLGLRLMSGVRWSAFEQRFGRDLRDVYAEPIARLHESGLVTLDQTGIRLAPTAYLIGNRVFAEFLRSSD